MVPLPQESQITQEIKDFVEDSKYEYHIKHGFIISKKTRQPIISYNQNGYLVFRDATRGGKMRRQHIALYEKATGVVPTLSICHKNGDPADNRWCNLHLGTHQQNMQERGPASNNTSGHKNISWRRDHNAWRVHFSLDKSDIHCGYFKNIEDAINARNEKMEELNKLGHRFIAEYC